MIFMNGGTVFRGRSIEPCRAIALALKALDVGYQLYILWVGLCLFELHTS